MPTKAVPVVLLGAEFELRLGVGQQLTL